MVSGSNGRRPIGNFLFAMFAHDSSSRMDASFWNSTGARTVLHSLLQNCGIFSCRKVRGSSAGKRCSQGIQINVRDSKYSSRDPSCGTTLHRAKRLQFPIRAIPAEHLLDVCDVFREQIVEEDSLLPVHCALVGHNISIFAAHRTHRFDAEKRKDRSESFELFLLKSFEFGDLHLLSRKELEDPGELPPIKSSIDISKPACFSRRRTTNARLLFPHGIKEV